MGEPRSLTFRVQWVVGAVVLAAVCAIGVVLDRAFASSTEMGVHERMQLNVYSLLAASEYRDGRPRLPEEVNVPGFNQVDSGLYGFVLDSAGHVLWQSQSMMGRQFDAALAAVDDVARGHRRFDTVTADGGGRLFAVSQGVAWEADGSMAEYVVVVLQSMTPFQHQLWAWRRSLWGGLAAVVLTLLAVEYLVLRWAFAPLRGVVGDLRAIQDGRSDRLPGRYPRELLPLTSSFNEVFEQEQRQRERYRNSLADLAHSIKTPLAVLRGHLDGIDERHRHQLSEQVARLDEIVSYQLQRAVIAGRRPLLKPVAAAPVLEKVVRSLRKVYRDKPLALREDIDPEVLFYGDERDLFEVLGNLLDNAFKYAATCVEIAVGAEGEGRRRQLRISVGNDGDVIAAAEVRHLIQRGARIDSAQPGQGIGLAVVADIVDSYGGTVQVAPRDGGGLNVTVVL